MPEKAEISRQIFVTTSEIEALPSAVDWRKYGIVTPIKDEGQYGASWAFSITGALEGQHAKIYKKLVSLSEQNLIDCFPSCGNYGCNGGWMSNGYRNVTVQALDTEESYPYTGVKGPCRFNPNTIGVTWTGYTDIISGSELALQAAIAEIGPISIELDASHSSFQFYSSGVYNEPNCSSTQLNFAGLIVGYGTQRQDDYYIFKNCWSTSWGIHGYMLMSRNKKNQCGVATRASYPFVI
ncbi:unnamed protein product [Rotaria sp. Silwood1]|nr:unnamed protein product [Rotaria sp. Silwood1]CAF3488464.1 unnamed protein product [Rotaria sp. Silwood1]CAF4649814.1 unnamed protein product [Rotaria sp. Silwood1]